ncbi:hypothetical protein EPN90_04070 [Patescibacteria group bacterium]|nr:MAG: hypothetical protein EPN90_04070 [Patescibacteria group bacterium]
MQTRPDTKTPWRSEPPRSERPFGPFTRRAAPSAPARGRTCRETERQETAAERRRPALELAQTAATPELPSFAEPRDFREREPIRDSVHYVDPRGYPMLYPFVPVTREGLIRLRRTLRSRRAADGTRQDLSPHFLSECRLHQNFVQRLCAAEGSDRPRLFVEHLSEAYTFPWRTADETYEAFADYVRRGWEMVNDFIKDFVPVSLRAPFTGDGRANLLWDPVTLLFECAATSIVEQSVTVQMRAFEMRRALVLAQELMSMDLGVAREERVLWVEREFVARLEERFFEPNLDQNVTVRAAIEQATGHVSGILGSEDPPPNCRVQLFPFHVRFFRYAGRLYPVFFNPDQKRLAAVLLKMMGLFLRDPAAVPDLNRFHLVCRNRRELGACLERIHETVFPVGGTAHYYDSNFRAFCAADIHNPAASADYRLVKVDHWLHGDKIEGQYLTLRDYIEALTSLGPVSHRRYKERRLRGLRTLLLPPALYGVDWESPEVLEAIAA